MTESRWQEEWRPLEPLPGFARRVVLELEREERPGEPAIDAHRASRRRPGSPLVVLGLAALLIAGAAAAALGRRFRPTLDPIPEESAPSEKQDRESPRFLLVSAPVPMEPERAKDRPRAHPAVRPAEAAHAVPPEATAPPVPIHYPACHCSSGAVVCSCVD